MKEEFDKILYDYRDIKANSFYNCNFKRLGEFLKLHLNQENKEDVIKFIIDNLETILKYTDLSNVEYLKDKDLILKNEFIEKLINILQTEYIKDIEFKLRILKYSYINLNKLDIYKKIFSGENIKNYLKRYDKFEIETEKESFYYFIFSEVDDILSKEILFLELVKRNFPIEDLHFEDNYFYEKYTDIFIKLSENLFDFRKKIELPSKNLVRKVNMLINENIELSLNSIINECSKTSVLKNDKTIREVFKMIILDVIKNENAKLSDVIVNNSGMFSTVLIIKDKVIKISSMRGTTKFTDNPYIIRPILRLTTNPAEYFIEVTERANRSKVSYQRMYDFYKKVRNLKIIFADIKDENLGTLRKDNIIHWKNELPITSERLGLKDNPSNLILKKGDLVLIDNDFIYDENDKNLNFTFSTPLEKQFLSELDKLLKDIELLIKEGYSFDDINIREKIINSGFSIDYIYDKINNKKETEEVFENIYKKLNW